MSKQKRISLEIKTKLHPRNKHRESYGFDQLIQCAPSLSPFVKNNEYNDQTIDFADPEAVMMLNKALLRFYYGIDYFDIPQGYLCPPVPGRADYLHYVADLLANSNNKIVPSGKHIRCIDVGVGANCIYPLLGVKEYGWSFVGSDIDQLALHSAQRIIDLNSDLNEHIVLRQQRTGSIFKGIIQADEKFDLTICNPPFHASKAEANAGTLRKLSNLKHEAKPKKVLNFGGRSNELWCRGGELGFVQNMIRESLVFRDNCLWFTSLLSKQSNVRTIVFELKKNEVQDIKIIPMGQGNKVSRIIAWTFQSFERQMLWAQTWNRLNE